MSNKLIGVIEDSSFNVQVQITERGLPGSDGYTPIKGIDYFDGQDGYTPIKGVDYFDGEKGDTGEKGADGKDGIDATTTEVATTTTDGLMSSSDKVKLDEVQQELTQHKLDYTEQRQQDQLKVATIDKELNDYQATMATVNVNQEAKQKVNGYGTISLPKNTANGQVSSIGVKGLTATNLVKNGNFEGGTTGWNINSGTRVVVYDDILKKNVMEIAGNGHPYPGAIQAINVIEGNKVYVSCVVKRVSGEGTKSERPYLGVGVMGGIYIDNTVYQRLSTVQSVDSSKFIFVLGGNTSNITAVVRFADILVVDLTQAFGAGNEPTVEQCDKIFANYFDGTKSTISASRLKSVGKNLFDFSKYKVEDFNRIYGEYKVFKLEVKPNTSYIVSGEMNEANGQVALIIVKSLIIDAANYKTAYFREARAQATIETSESGELYIGLRDVSQMRLTNYFDDIIKFQLEEGAVATPYEPYTESTQYLPNVGELRSLPNGTKDEVGLSENKLIKRIGEKTNVASGAVINYADMADNGTYYAWNDDGETETGAKGDTLGIDATELIYQLANEIVTPIQVSGTLLSNPSGTIYVENVVADAGLYGDKLNVLHTDLPIKEVEKVSKVDFTTGVEAELDVSQCVIAEDKLSFTHTDLANGDIVFFTYYYDLESTLGETTVEYYDSRHTLKDDVTGKFYKIVPKISDGVLTNELVEV